VDTCVLRADANAHTWNWSGVTLVVPCTQMARSCGLRKEEQDGDLESMAGVAAFERQLG